MGTRQILFSILSPPSTEGSGNQTKSSHLFTFNHCLAGHQFLLCTNTIPCCLCQRHHTNLDHLSLLHETQGQPLLWFSLVIVSPLEIRQRAEKVDLCFQHQLSLSSHLTPKALGSCKEVLSCIIQFKWTLFRRSHVEIQEGVVTKHSVCIIIIALFTGHHSGNAQTHQMSSSAPVMCTHSSTLFIFKAFCTRHRSLFSFIAFDELHV